MRDKGTIWENPANEGWSNSQGVLIYPGKHINSLEAVGSIRLNQLRRGLQDYEYIYLAKQNGKDPSAIVDTMIPHALTETRRGGGSPGEWPHDPADWYWARRQLANLIMSKPIEPAKNSAADKLSKKNSKEKVLFYEDFESGQPGGWTGGKPTNKDTFQGSKYSLQAIAGGEKFIFVEKWEKIPVKNDAVISFNYYCENSSKIFVNLWSNALHKNLSCEINAPREKQWTLAELRLSDFKAGYSGYVDSIHIAVDSGENSRLVVDDVKVEGAQ